MTIASSQPFSPLDSPIEPDHFPAPPTDLPYDDGEPLETPRHRSAMNLLIRSLDHHWIDRNEYFVGGNMFLYYSATQAKNRDFRGPDFFVSLEVDRSRDRKYWAIWDEGGKYPDVIVELMSLLRLRSLQPPIPTGLASRRQSTLSGNSGQFPRMAMVTNAQPLVRHLGRHDRSRSRSLAQVLRCR